jgi:hypothetical protein
MACSGYDFFAEVFCQALVAGFGVGGGKRRYN